MGDEGTLSRNGSTTMDLNHGEDDAHDFWCYPSIVNTLTRLREFVVIVNQLIETSLQIVDAQSGQVVGFGRNEELVTRDDGSLRHDIEVRWTVDKYDVKLAYKCRQTLVKASMDTQERGFRFLHRSTAQFGCQVQVDIDQAQV